MIDYFCQDLLLRLNEAKDNYVQALARGCLKNMEEYREHIGMINATKQAVDIVRNLYLERVSPKEKEEYASEHN